MLKTRRVAKGPMGQLRLRRIACFFMLYVLLMYVPFCIIYFWFPQALSQLLFCPSATVSIVFKVLISTSLYLGLFLALVQECHRVRFPVLTFFKQKPAQEDKKWLFAYPLIWGAICFCALPEIIFAENAMVFLNNFWGKWMVSCCDRTVLVSHNTTYLVTTLIAAPVVEELFFRGVMIHRLSVKYGMPAGVILSALAFGLFTGMDLGMVFMGLILGMLYVHTGSLRFIICLHIVHNFLLVFVDLMIAYGYLDFRQSAAFLGFYLVGSICFSCVLLAGLKHKQYLFLYPPFLRDYSANSSGK